MDDEAKIAELLNRYTPEQLARAYLKASRERNEAQRNLRLVNRVDRMMEDVLPGIFSGYR